MKTLGRILIILLAAAIVSAAIIGAVNATRSINFSGRPEGGDFRPQGNQQFQGDRPQGDFPEGGFPGERPDRDREGGGGSFSRIALGFLKNTVVIALLVVVIAVPRNLLSKRKRSTSQEDTTSANEEL